MDARRLGNPSQEDTVFAGLSAIQINSYDSPPSTCFDLAASISTLFQHTEPHLIWGFVGK